MGKYSIGYRVLGRLNLRGEEFTYSVMGHKLILVQADDTEKTITLFVEIEGATLDDAINSGHEYADKLLDAISFKMHTSLYISGIRIVYESQPGERQRQAYVLEYSDPGSSLWLRPDLSEDIQSMIDRSEPKDELALPMRWLRIAYKSTSNIEQFIYYWLALETYVGRKTKVTRCKCGEEKISNPTDLEQLYGLIKRYCPSFSKTENERREIYDLRNKFFHGGGGFNIETSQIASKYWPILQNVVEEIIREDTGVNKAFEILKHPLREGRTHQTCARIEFTASQIEEPFAYDYPSGDYLNDKFLNGLFRGNPNDLNRSRVI